MLRLFITLTFLAALSCNAQSGNNSEFKIYDNGLIYSPVTMTQLTHIVDSLNLKFKRCDLSRKYYGLSQGFGHYISLDTGNVTQARKDITNNIGFDEFVKKYKYAEVDRDMLITKVKYKSYYDKKWVVEFSGQTMEDYGGPEITIENDPDYFSKQHKGKWIMEHSKKTDYSDEYLNAFYITEGFANKKIPEKYARMILYSDCVIDTTVDIFTAAANNSGIHYYTEDKGYKKSKLYAFNNYIEQNTKQITEKDVPAVYKEYKWHAVDSMKEAWIRQNIVNTEKFKQLLSDAVKETKEKSSSTTDKFEEYVATYVSKADALAMKRNRRVIGGCSMDQSPRYHALNIAMLSAETVNWQVFLRAHLNIMNDRFERMSDGSWAWAGRNTYIKELEELNIDVSDLLLGISFRMEDPVEKHYYGSINRLGRALAETKYKDQFEKQIIEIIKDPELDTYNRMLMHYLYLNYIYNLPEEKIRMASLSKLEEADMTLPYYISSRIKINRKNFEEKSR